jgi:FtsP/CotA-like multicopper oxidase with cupredoxin domain
MGEPTTLHWHGMLLPAAMDGGPHQHIAPDTMWQPQFDIRQQAATLWYHSHEMEQTRAQVTRGLASMFIIDDNNPAQAALPHTYGVDDIPLILQGYVFNGGQTLVNGALTPTLVTDQPRLRLRLLNASDQQIYTFGFAGNVAFDQVASDGGLLNAPIQLTRLQLGPAERAEIVVDVTGAPLVLQRIGGGGGPGGFTINGQSISSMAQMMDMSNALRVRLGDMERWNVVNNSGQTHPFHIHNIQFQILNGNGAAPGPTELGRKDTVMVRPGETLQLLMQFVDYADPNTAYMYHCHILQHEDQGMMGQFVVVAA